MRPRTIPLLSLVALLSVLSNAHGTIVINFAARTVTDQLGAPLAAGTLVQLVNLGADGFFNPINPNDGNASQLGQWVSGDDTLVNAAYLNPGGAAGDFPSAAAFDLVNGDDTIPGRINRAFEFKLGDIPTNAKLGIRWFPGLQAADFATATLACGQAYGQFTRQTTPLYLDTTMWVFPSDGANVTFDNLTTTDRPGGLDPAVSGQATSFLLLCPEPSAIVLTTVGTVGLVSLRRRRS